MNSLTTDASFNGENNICRKEEIINESTENVPKKFMLLSSKLYSVYLAQTHTHTHSHSHSASVFKNSKLNCDHNNRKIMPHQINRTHRPQKNSILFSKTLISSNQFKGNDVHTPKISRIQLCPRFFTVYTSSIPLQKSVLSGFDNFHFSRGIFFLC